MSDSDTFADHMQLTSFILEFKTVNKSA